MGDLIAQAAGRFLPELVLVLVFLTAASVALGLSGLLVRGRGFAERLHTGQAGGAGADVSLRHREDTLVRNFSTLPKYLIPKKERRRLRVQRTLVRAGYRRPTSLQSLYAIRILAALASLLVFVVSLPALAPLLPSWAVPVLLLASVLGGYFLPYLYVLNRAAERDKQLRVEFPDALDLILVCVESGLGIDAALARVADELTQSHKLVAEELRTMHLELRAGISREQALDNLAQRTGVAEITGFAHLLIQSTRIGASIGDALRVAADEMRLRRLLRAEERAAKVPVKMVLPMVLFLMPCMMLVVALPAFIRLVREILPAMTGQG